MYGGFSLKQNINKEKKFLATVISLKRKKKVLLHTRLHNLNILICKMFGLTNNSKFEREDY